MKKTKTKKKTKKDWKSQTFIAGLKLKVHKQNPLVLLLQVSRRQGRILGSEI